MELIYFVSETTKKQKEKIFKYRLTSLGALMELIPRRSVLLLVPILVELMNLRRIVHHLEFLALLAKAMH